MRSVGAPTSPGSTPLRRRRRCPGALLAAPLLLVGASSTWGGDDVPELLPPIDTAPSPVPPRLVSPTRSPIVSTPAPAPTLTLVPAFPPAGDAAVPSPTPASTPPSSTAAIVRPAQAVLAVPGVSIPGATRKPALLPMPPIAESAPRSGPGPDFPTLDPGEPTLSGPVEMPDLATTPRRDAASSLDDDLGTLPRSRIPAPIADPVIEDQSTPGTSRGPASRRSTTRVESGPAGRSATDRPATATPTPARRGRFFGLFPAPLAVQPPTLAARSTPVSNRSGRAADEADPLVVAAQAALKARIEKQATAYVGDRARSIEVQVDQRSAVIHARGVKLFQKRGVRKTLEGLPALSGLRTTIDVED